MQSTGRHLYQYSWVCWHLSQPSANTGQGCKAFLAEGCKHRAKLQSLPCRRLQSLPRRRLQTQDKTAKPPSQKAAKPPSQPSANTGQSMQHCNKIHKVVLVHWWFSKTLTIGYYIQCYTMQIVKNNYFSWKKGEGGNFPPGYAAAKLCYFHSCESLFKAFPARKNSCDNNCQHITYLPLMCGQ